MQHWPKRPETLSQWAKLIVEASQHSKACPVEYYLLYGNPLLWDPFACKRNESWLTAHRVFLQWLQLLKAFILHDAASVLIVVTVESL